MRAKLCAREHERVGNVVAIPDKRHLQFLETALGFPHGEIVGHRLAGMAVVGEPVNDGDGRVLGHLLDDFVGEGANHDALHHAFEVLRDVIDRFAFPEIDFGGREINGETTELLDAHVERHARAQRRLLEDHRQRFPLQRVAIGRRMRLHLASQNQEVENFRRREIFNR